MQIFWGRQACKQLAEAHEFILRDNPEAADDQLEAILRSVDKLADFPALGRAGRMNETRELLVPGTPYTVVYRVGKTELRVLALLHAVRRWSADF